MSLRDKKKITCPACYKSGEFILWESITVALNPDLREQLFSGELYTYRCKCGAKIQVESPLLYNDLEHKFMISYVPHEGMEDYPVGDIIKTFPPHVIRKFQQSGLRLRSVSSREELLDKIVQLESKYSDQQLEMLKVYIKEALLQSNIACDTPTDMFFYAVEDGELYCMIPKDEKTYRPVLVNDELLSEYFPAGMKDDQNGFEFMKIDQKWVEKKLSPKRMM